MKKVRVPIFTEEYAINLCIGEKEKLVKEAARYCNESEDFIRRMFNGRGLALDAITKVNKHPLIIVDGSLPCIDSLPTVAHEACHAMDYITSFIGMNDISGEFRAHGVSAVLRTVTRLISSKKKL